MTDSEAAATVAELRDHLDEFPDDAPVAVKASGAYDFLDPDGLDDSTLTSGGDVVFLDGDTQ